MLSKIIKKEDGYSVKSKSMLKSELHKIIKDVFIRSLRCIEIRFGRDFEGFDSLRSEILRTGNDAVRKMETLIEEGYNIESLPDLLVIKCKGKEKQ